MNNSWRWSVFLLVIALLCASAYGSRGDRLGNDWKLIRMDPPATIHRWLWWDCNAECDYACQHIVTDHREQSETPFADPVYQFHGKWPFLRFLGMQEPFSVLCSLLNYLAHAWGVGELHAQIPRDYKLRRYYLMFGYFGMFTWIASMVFHTRDFDVTEKVDYFAAGLNVIYGLYYAPIRIFRWDDPKGTQPWKRSVLRLWTVLCAAAYVAHVSYLSFWRFSYSYNMMANIACGILTNILWTTFAWARYRKSRKWWQAWPGMIVAWVVFAMSMEVLDFAPWRRMIDAHSLWHLGTVGPTIWWYNFLIKDALEDLHSQRLETKIG